MNALHTVKGADSDSFLSHVLAPVRVSLERFEQDTVEQTEMRQRTGLRP
jgi:hypothetical protein